MLRVGPMDTSSEISHHTNSEGPSPMDEDAGEAALPIAVFDEVTEGSPAAMDGILVGDQLLKFGSVDGGDNLLMRLAQEGQDSEGQGLHVVVLRRGESVHLTVTPRRWSGRGLLGYGSLPHFCHFLWVRGILLGITLQIDCNLHLSL